MLIAPLVLGFAFENIITLRARFEHKKRVQDVLQNKTRLDGIMVDLNAQQRRCTQRLAGRRGRRAFPMPRAEAEDKEREREKAPVTVLDEGSKGTTSTIAMGDLEAARGSSSKNIAHHLVEPKVIVLSPGEAAAVASDEKQSQQSQTSDAAPVMLPPAEENEEETKAEEEEAADDAADQVDEGIFGGISARLYSNPRASFFGIKEEVVVTKSDFILSVLLHLNKLKFEPDVYIWAKVGGR